jgi:ABC-type microcin C transport system permease subunit YejE
MEAMAGSLPWSQAPPPPPSNEPTELLRRIDQNTQQIFHWVRAGFVVAIVLLIIVIFIG